MSPSSSQSKTVSKSQLVKLYRQAVAAGLPIDTVHHKIESFAERSQLTLRVEEQNDQKQLQNFHKKLPLRTRIIIHLLPVFCVMIGLFLVSNAIWPILSYFVFPESHLLGENLLSPVPENAILDAKRPFIPQVQAQSSASSEPVIEEPIMLAEDLDYSNLNNWFPEMTEAQELALNKTPAEGSVQEYVLDIPTLNVEDARVKIGGTNLDKSLIQYPGTAMPGEPGSPVIFGHSVLRQFYNPSVKNSRRYMSIFSKIMTLKKGDRVYVTIDGVKYTYEVEEKTEVKPEDTFILEQNYDNKMLKLITCVPEGTYLRRGVVTARLVEGVQ